jgi:hypothetical protein
LRFVSFGERRWPSALRCACIIVLPLIPAFPASAAAALSQWLSAAEVSIPPLDGVACPRVYWQAGESRVAEVAAHACVSVASASFDVVRGNRPPYA